MEGGLHVKAPGAAHPISPINRATQLSPLGEDARDAEGDTEAEADMQVDEAERGAGDERAINIPRSPDSPTRAQIEEHRARAHLPYRSWCGDCVAGRKKNPPHYRVKDDSGRLIPQVCLDYAFLRDLDETETITCLVCKDTGTRTLFGDVCPKKGALEYSVDMTLSNVRKLGYKRLSLKTDQEPALIALATQVICQRPDETLLEHSQVAESASNGVIEKGVQQLEEQVRVLKLGLQGRIGSHIPTTHPIIAWLVPHAADVLNKLEVGADGKTAYERLRGKRYKGEIVEFGAKIQYRIPGALQPGHGKLEPRWADGIWLGKRFESDEHYVGTTAGGITKCRAISQVPATDRWDKEAIERLTGVPWAWSGEARDMAHEPVFRDLPPDGVPDPDLQMPAPVPRQLKSTRDPREVRIYPKLCSMSEHYESGAGDDSSPRATLQRAPGAEACGRPEVQRTTGEQQRKS
jgi:hypothetical protein